jgi:GPH family glycoside/pentoside/hexuronide:cation symporter
LAYATGDGATSLIMNSIFGFSMLYYTEALGLAPIYAGLAMGVATIWDALTDPIMGHVTDNTRSKYGRRHPYMLLGGLISIACFYMIWVVPKPILGGPMLYGCEVYLFSYLVIVNLLLRTGITVYLVAHGALGFEVCTDYNQRTTLQGVRVGLNMAVNLAGPAMAWMIFFRETGEAKAIRVAENYQDMGLWFAIAALGFVLFVVFATRKYIVDTRDRSDIGGGRVGDVYANLKDILLDPYPRTVFIFAAIVMLGIVLVSSLQMYVYDYFMSFASVHKTLVHGGSMVGCGMGGLVAGLVVRRIDKKPGVYLSVIVGCIANAMLILLFLTRIVDPRLSLTVFGLNTTATGGLQQWIDFVEPSGWYVRYLLSAEVPVAVLVFLFFHAVYWMGNGTMLTIAQSMMPDVSEICRYHTGVLKDGGYAAMLSFVTKLSMAIGLFASGMVLSWVGFEGGDTTPNALVTWDLAITTFVVGILFALVAMSTIVRYPVTREFMENIKQALAEHRTPPEAEGVVPPSPVAPDERSDD